MSVKEDKWDFSSQTVEGVFERNCSIGFLTQKSWDTLVCWHMLCRLKVAIVDP